MRSGCWGKTISASGVALRDECTTLPSTGCYYRAARDRELCAAKALTEEAAGGHALDLRNPKLTAGQEIGLLGPEIAKA